MNRLNLEFFSRKAMLSKGNICMILILVGLKGYSLGAEKPHLFILSGQSNMTAGVAKSFKNVVWKVFGKEKALICKVAHPGQPIKNWVKSWQPPNGQIDKNKSQNGKFYPSIIQQAKKKLEGRVPASVTLIWMQGETDAGNGWGSVYKKSFLSLVEQLKNDLKVEKVNFVVGRINEHWLSKPDGEMVRKILVELGEKNDHGSWINTDDINRGVNPWGGFSFEDGHYPLSGYVVMGQRFAHKACLLAEPGKKLEAKLFHEHFIDSHKDIGGHEGSGKVVSSNNALFHKDTLKVLVDQKFGLSDSSGTSWVKIPPSKKSFELIVDLGQLKEVDELGVNILLSKEAKSGFPKYFIYSTSVDGKKFRVHNRRYNTVKVYNQKKFNAKRSKVATPQSVLLLTKQHVKGLPVTARYIKIEIFNPDKLVLIDEIVVNPKQKLDE